MSTPYLVERLFSGMFLAGAFMTLSDYYLDNFQIKIPKGHTLIIKNKLGQLNSCSGQEQYNPIPYFDKTFLFQADSKYEIKSKASSKDLDVVNLHLMVDSKCLDPVKMFQDQGENVENVEQSIQENLSDRIRETVRQMSFREANPKHINEKLRSTIEQNLKQKQPHMDMQVEVLKVLVEGKVKYRYLPELLI